VVSGNSTGFLRWETIPGLVTRHARSLLAIILVITVLALLQLIDIRTGELQLGIDPSVERLLAPDDEAYLYYQSARRIFGSDETIVLLLQSDDVFTAENMDIVSRLTRRLERVDGVVRVVSLANALTIHGSEFGVDIESWEDLSPETPGQVSQFRERILSNPMYAGSLVARDGNATALLVSLTDTPGYAFLSRVENDVRAVIAEEAADQQIWLTGPPVLNVATTNTLLEDMIRIPAIVVLVMALVLFICFRRASGVLVPLTSVGISVIWTLAVTTRLGYTLNIVTVLVPTLLMIISLSYSVHVVAEFLGLAASGEQEKRTPADALRSVFLPVIFTGLTTAIGFLSLTLSPLAAISEFGILSVIGILFAMLVTLTWTPAILTVLLSFRTTTPRPVKHRRESRFDRLALRIGQLDARYRVPVFSIAGILFVIALVGMSNIRVGIEYITNFEKDTPVRLAYEKANDLLGGANIFYVVIESGSRDAIKEPVNLRAIRELQTWLNEQPDIGGTISMVNYIELLNSAFNDNDPAKRLIPATKKEIGQLLFFGANDDLETLVDSRYQTANVIVRTRAVNSDDLSALVDRVNTRLAQLPSRLQARVTGNPVLIDDVLDKIIRGQLKSVFAALLIVYGVLVGMFLSFKVGLIALIPNIFPIVTYFGALGYLGISLNPSNSLIAPMVLGIAIDDTVHYFARFNELMKQQTDSRHAAIESLRIVGRPVTYTSVALCLGFLVLTGSELKMQEQVGLMASFALAFAWLYDFTLTPALCSRLRIATIWDALTLDLGKRPQDTIPLFRGMSNFQARIVARMASIRTIRAGERLIQSGQPGKEMFAVIDGKLQASIEGEKERINLDSHVRGDVVGEAGLFYAQRTADVDAVEDSRLLCINQNDLKVLRRRYPRIAARVANNLNEILANRLVNATQRLT
jgi:predicted RND superfamily exporter protein